MLERDLAEYAVHQRSTELPSAVVHHGKRAIIDWFAAMLPGGLQPPASAMLDALADEIGAGGARLYPFGRRASARTAALINGTSAHLVEFDDIFRDAIYHPGAPVIAAALATGQATDASGEALIRAVVVGYEISTRIAIALSPAHYTYWHTTGTVGTIGAAAASATLLQLDAERIAHAISTSVTFAAGLQQAFRSEAMSKPLHSGRAAEGGVLAALLAARGVTGAADMLDGERGFGHATSKNCDWTKAVDGLGSRYNIQSMTIKNHGCCGHTFAAIDGALALREKEGLRADDIDRIEVATYQTALDVTGNPAPTGEFEARFSLPFVVASAFVHGSVRLNAFTHERLNDVVVRRLLQHFVLKMDPQLNAQFPQRRAARVIVDTTDGRRLEILQPTRKGDPDLPLTDEELEDKYRELAGAVIGHEQAAELLRRLWSLDSLESLNDLGVTETATAPTDAAERSGMTWSIA